MQAGSTGLGKIALKMKVADKSEMNRLPPTRPPEGSIVFYCKTWDPVIWDVWIGIEPNDVLPMLRLAFRKETIALLFTSLFRVLMLKLGIQRAVKNNADQS